MKATVLLMSWLLVSVWASGMVGNSAEAQGCSSTFFTTLMQLMPCRAAVSPFSPAPPSDACCNAVRALGQSCLCVLVNGPPVPGVDRTMALQLPSKCATNFEPCGAGV